MKKQIQQRIMLLAALIMLANISLAQRPIITFKTDTGRYFFGDSIICFDVNFINDHLADFDLSAENNVVVRNSFTHANQITTYYYDQYYDGLKVADGSGVVNVYQNIIAWIDPSFVHDLNMNTAPTISGESAVQILLDSIDATMYAWEDPTFELEYQELVGDEEATTYPTPQKMISPKDADHLLAWQIQIITLEPTYINKTYWVDAHTGEIIASSSRKDGCTPKYGSCTTAYNGSHGINTCESWGKQKLCNTSHNIHTKKYETNNQGEIKYWSNLNNYKDSDGNWGTNDQAATSAHWATTMAHGWYAGHWNRPCPDGAGKVETRIYAAAPFNNVFSSDGDARTGYGGSARGSDASVFSIEIGTNTNGRTLADIETMGHEYTHGHIYYTSKIGAIANDDNEAGALKEAFCDIMGVLIEQSVEGGAMEWMFSENPENGVNGLRNFEFGTSAVSGYTQALGYQRALENWDTNEDKYINMGVVNKWFQLLKDGTLDLPGQVYNGYKIEPHTIYDVRWIAYFTMVSLNVNSNFMDARALSIAFSADERSFANGGPDSPNFGKCKQLWRDVHRAWAAVGVGNGPPNCADIITDQHDEDDFCEFRIPTGSTTFIPITAISDLFIRLEPNDWFKNNINNTTSIYNWTVPAGVSYLEDGKDIIILALEEATAYPISLEIINEGETQTAHQILRVYDPLAIEFQCLNEFNCNELSLSQQNPNKNGRLTNKQQALEELASMRSLESSKEAFDFQITPNPSRGVFNCNILGVPESITITNNLGVVIKSIKTNASNEQVFLNGLQSGVYLVTITSQQGEKRTKQIVVIN